MNSLPRKWKKRICQTGFLPVTIRVRVGLLSSLVPPTQTELVLVTTPPPSFLPVSYDSLLVGEGGGDTTRVESLPQEHNTGTSLGIDSRLLILPSFAQWQSRYLFRILDSQLPEMMFKVGLFSFSGFTVLISTLQILWFPSKIQCLLKEKIEGGVIVD